MKNTAVFLVFFVIAGFFLITEHRAHLYGALPYVFLFSCFFMHLFHGEHGGKKGGGHGH